MPETSIAEAMSLMRFYQCDGLPVVVDKEFVGYIQLRDVLTIFFADKTNKQEYDPELDVRRLQSKYAPIVRATVNQFMNGAKRSVPPLTSVGVAVDIMLNEHVDRMAVTEGNKLVGMVSLDDVNKVILGLTSTNVAA